MSHPSLPQPRRLDFLTSCFFFAYSILLTFLERLASKNTPDHVLLDRSPSIGPLISRWELDKFKNR